jgi:hypothetical protein
MNLSKNTIFRVKYRHKDNDSDIGKFLTYIFGLLFLEPEMVGECCVIDLVSIQPSTAKIQTFCDNLVNIYINDDSDFPSKIWTTCSSSMCLTTNACDSFHSKFNSLFSTIITIITIITSHPSIFQFLEILKQCQTDAKIKIKSIVCTPRKTNNN